MEAFLIYILKASGILLLFFLIYQVFLKKETFFKANRHFLLAGLILAFILPFITITKYIDVKPVVYEGISNVSAYSSIVTAESALNWLQVLSIIYFVGMGYLLIKFLLQLLSLRTLIRKHKARIEEGYIYVETSKNVAPFSFFNYIFYNPGKYNATELEAILRHEKAHSSQWHSLDILIAHLFTIILWINPLGWLYKKNIKQNLEFLADASAAKGVSSIKNYQYTLLRVSGIPYCTPITNAFYNSLIKKRIIMLHKSKSNKRNLFKYLLVLPLLASFVFLFNIETKANILPASEPYSYISEPTFENEKEYVITKETTDEQITAWTKDLKSEGAQLIVKKLKRNPNGLITSIKISLKTPDSEVEGQYTNEEGIPAIRFGIREDGGLFIYRGDHNILFQGKHSVHIESDNDTDDEHDDDKDIDVHFENSDHDTSQANVWISSDEGEKRRIEIDESQGERTIKVDGKVVTEAELEEMEKDNSFVHKRIMVRSSDTGSKDDVMIFISDDDDKKDVKAEGKSGNGFFYVDTYGDKSPLYILDGKQVSEKEVRWLNPDQISTISVIKDKKAIEKYGNKAKDGVVEITSKTKD